MTLSNLFLTAKFEFVIISRHLVVKEGSQKSSVLKEFGHSNRKLVRGLNGDLLMQCTSTCAVGPLGEVSYRTSDKTCRTDFPQVSRVLCRFPGPSATATATGSGKLGTSTAKYHEK